MIFDPLYWMIIGVGMLLSVWASAKTKGTFHKYSQIPTRSGLTGADIARNILRDNNIGDVTIEPMPGNLTDHYDPRTKTLRLSEDVYGSNSMAAFGVAAHEVGHAIQHAEGYAPLKFRSAWVPIANTGGTMSMFIIIAAVVLGAGTAVGGGVASALAVAGLALFATTTVFTLITLPVEFDASKRALLALERGGYVTQDEHTGAKKVLSAAAMTYVAAFITSLLTLLYWAYVLFGRRD